MPARTVPRIGRYDIVGLLATGGMAEILLGRLVGPNGFERPIVVKRILPHLARVPAFVNMFIDEARIVASICHPNVVSVQELAHEDNELFLVMEYLEGESVGSLVRRLVARSDSLNRGLAAFVIAEACAGLHAAHELRDQDGLPRDLVHRDISPQNVFVTYSGQVKVLDFGIAKAANRNTRTEAGQVKGKFAYMSPEQCLGKPLDRRSDLFALGIVLWELTTGRRLFTRGSEHLTFKAICDERILRPSEIAPGYPALLERVVMKALERRREDRYRTAQEMRRDLLSAARKLGVSELPEDDLSKLMHALFAERITEKQEMLRCCHTGNMPLEIPAAEADESVELPSVIEDLSTVQTSADVGSPAVETRRWPLAVLAMLAIATVAVLVGRHLGTQRQAVASARPLPSPKPAVAPPGPAPKPSSSAPAARVLLRIETTPAGADAVVQGRLKGQTPIDLRLDRSDQPVFVTLTHRGYRPRREKVVPNINQRLVLPLTPLRREAPARPEAIPKFR